MKKGTLIVFEGTDGSGKSTQFKLLCDRLQTGGTPFRRLIFPQYQEPSSALLKMYLNGEFGSHPSDVNPYAASTFYAVDRYAAWKKDWGDDYRAGTLILSDRYTTSNAVHQGGKVSPADQPAFFDWLFDFEYHKLGLPEPDLATALAGAPDRTARILLDHRPGNAPRNARQDVDLQLSGHTHGGHAPGLSALVALFNHGYVRGWYRVEGMPLYVSSGAGLWNGFPLRVDVPSEIALITLRRGPAGAASAGSRM